MARQQPLEHRGVAHGIPSLPCPSAPPQGRSCTLPAPPALRTAPRAPRLRCRACASSCVPHCVMPKRQAPQNGSPCSPCMPLTAAISPAWPAVWTTNRASTAATEISRPKKSTFRSNSSQNRLIGTGFLECCHALTSGAQAKSGTLKTTAEKNLISVSPHPLACPHTDAIAVSLRPRVDASPRPPLLPSAHLQQRSHSTVRNRAFPGAS